MGCGYGCADTFLGVAGTSLPMSTCSCIYVKQLFVLHRPEDWYMKADADSFLNVPLIEQRLRLIEQGDVLSHRRCV